MNWQDASLVLAGVIGSGVAVVHGVLVQRLMVHPLRSAVGPAPRMSGSVGRLIPALLHFTTFNWLLGGFALIAAATVLGAGARSATALLVGSSYLYGAGGNLWATRGRHPGWVLYLVAAGLIAYGAVTPIGACSPAFASRASGV